jgi:hypothetical protein
LGERYNYQHQSPLHKNIRQPWDKMLKENRKNRQNHRKTHSDSVLRVAKPI